MMMEHIFPPSQSAKPHITSPNYILVRFNTDNIKILKKMTKNLNSNMKQYQDNQITFRILLIVF